MGRITEITKDNDVFTETRDRLNNVGPGMCLAKWTQVTLQLQTGHNHSCHHQEHIKFQKKKLQEIQVLYTTLNIKNFVEEKC